MKPYALVFLALAAAAMSPVLAAPPAQQSQSQQQSSTPQYHPDFRPIAPIDPPRTTPVHQNGNTNVAAHKSPPPRATATPFARPSLTPSYPTACNPGYQEQPRATPTPSPTPYPYRPYKNTSQC